MNEGKLHHDMQIKIIHYWAERGYIVNVRVETFSSATAKGIVYVLRSDMINGLPKDYRP